MANFSFDIVSDFDKAELNNVYDQVQREMLGRYDFKGTSAAIEWLDADKTGLKITGDSDWQIEAIIDIIRKKLAARNQSQKILDLSAELISSNMKVTQNVLFKKGLDQTKAKFINNLIRDEKLKVKTQIQGDEIRVTSASKDELQKVMSLVNSQDLEYPINFTNYR